MACQTCDKEPGDCKCCGKTRPESDYHNRNSNWVVTPDGDSYCSKKHEDEARERARYSWL